MNLRQVGEFLVAPLHDLDGNLAGLRLLDAHGEEDVWPKTAILLPYITGDAAHSATVVRGTLADAMAIRIACGTQVLQIPLAADAAALRAAMLALRPERTVLIAEASMAAAATRQRYRARCADADLATDLSLQWRDRARRQSRRALRIAAGA